MHWVLRITRECLVLGRRQCSLVRRFSWVVSVCKLKFSSLFDLGEGQSYGPMVDALVIIVLLHPRRLLHIS